MLVARRSRATSIGGSDRTGSNAFTWHDSPTVINVPDLTLEERLLVDSLLPDHPIEKIQEELGFLFSSKAQESLKMLETYSLFYRQAPHFPRIIF